MLEHQLLQERLKKFYDVSTLDDLIYVQSKHIERLQEKLSNANPLLRAHIMKART